SKSAISGPASTMMLGTKHLVQEGLAIAAAVVAAASVLPEQIFAEVVRGWNAGRLALAFQGAIAGKPRISRSASRSHNHVKVLERHAVHPGSGHRPAGGTSAQPTWAEAKCDPP